MQYNAPGYAIAAPVAASSSKKITIIIIVIVVIILLLIALGIGLGVGLGVGLSKNDDNKSSGSGSSGSSSSSSTTSILSAPTVTCTYSNATVCGCAATQPTFLTPRIVQGYTAVANSWPWLVAIYINNNSTFCGGFLISYQHVITAGHCVNTVTTASGTVVYAGVQTLSSRTSTLSRRAANITLHPAYSESSTNTINDIAIITLESPFNQSTTVIKCCTTFDSSLPSLNEHGVIAGWGKTSTASTATISNDLQQGVIEVQTDATCFGTTASDNRFCAGYNGTNACNGDSGSPFMTSVNNLWTCTGIVSSSPSCGASTRYTRVTAYQSFIDGVVNG